MRIQDYTVQHDTTTASRQVLTRAQILLQSKYNPKTITDRGKSLEYFLKPLLKAI